MASPRGTTRSAPIDSLRALAMLGVVAMHAHLLPFGWVGVWLFYVISGYVVTRSILVRDAGERPAQRFAGFLRRRAARIVPLLFLYLLVGLGVGALIGEPTPAGSIASQFLFFNNLAMILGGGRIEGWPSGHLWTLSVEMQFYLVYGALLCLAPRRVTLGYLAATLALCPLARLAVGAALLGSGWPPLDAAFAVYAGPALHFDIFAMGALLAFAQPGAMLERLAPRIAVVGIGALGLYAAAYVAVNHLVRGEHGVGAVRNILSGILIGQHREVFLYSAVGLAMAGLVALAAINRAVLMPVLGRRALAAVGEISYGGYVFHQLGLKLAAIALALAGFHAHHRGLLENVLQLMIGLALTLALAAASYRWFETPVRRAIERGAHRTAPAAPLTPQPR